MSTTYIPFPPGTVRGPYYSNYPGYSEQVQYLVQGMNGWIPFHGAASREKEISKDAKDYAQKILNSETNP